MAKETLENSDLLEAYRTLALELKGTIGRVRRAQAKIEEIEELVFDTVLTELREKKISAYNASIAYANLINSACKLERLKLEILDRLTGAGPLVERNSTGSSDEKSHSPEIRRFAEQLLVQMASQSCRRRDEGNVPESRLDV